MNKLVKKILTITLALSMIFAVPTGAWASEYSASSIIMVEDGTIVTPNAWYQTKNVTEVWIFWYPSEIPPSVPYEEYDPNYKATFRGTLYLDSVIPKNGVYHATYKGTVGAYIF